MPQKFHGARPCSLFVIFSCCVAATASAQYSVGENGNWGSWAAIKGAPPNSKGSPSVEVSFRGARPNKQDGTRTIYRRYRNTSGQMVDANSEIHWIGRQGTLERDLVQLKPGEMKQDPGWWSVAQSVASVNWVPRPEKKTSPAASRSSTGEGVSSNGTVTFNADAQAAGRDADVRTMFAEAARGFRQQAAASDAAKQSGAAAFFRGMADYQDCLAAAAGGNAQTCSAPTEMPSENVSHDPADPHVMEFVQPGNDGKRVNRWLWNSAGTTYCAESLSDEPSAERPCVLANGSIPYKFGTHSVPDGWRPGYDRVIEFGLRDQRGAPVDRTIWDDGGTTYCSQTPGGKAGPESVCTYSNGSRPFEFREHATHAHGLAEPGPSAAAPIEAARQGFLATYTSLLSAATIAKANLRQASQLSVPGADWSAVGKRVRAATTIYDQMLQLFPNESATHDVQGSINTLAPGIRRECAADAIRRLGPATYSTMCNF
jgi:hypothetical protein